MRDSKKYVQTLLVGWEDVHKKSQLTLWVLLALKDSPKFMAEIKQFIEERTNQTITADDKSMYRALRRFADAELIDNTSEASKSGPDKKIYHLTDIGTQTLEAFLDRNIKTIFLDQKNQKLFS